MLWVTAFGFIGTFLALWLIANAIDGVTDELRRLRQDDEHEKWRAF